MSEEESVRLANARFYDAASALDIEQMDRVWLDAAAAVCVHPGREAIIGYAAIRESWRMIFFGTSSMAIVASDERVNLAGEAAWVSCTEHISMIVDGEIVAGSAQATNVFRRTPDGWRMVVHHASPIPLRAVVEEWPETIN